MTVPLSQFLLGLAVAGLAGWLLAMVWAPGRVLGLGRGPAPPSVPPNPPTPVPAPVSAAAVANPLGQVEAIILERVDRAARQELARQIAQVLGDGPAAPAPPPAG